MPNFVKVNDSANVTVIGMRLKGLADQFQAEADGLCASIDGIAAGAPWGNDRFGRQFRNQYLATGEDGRVQVEALLEELRAVAGGLGDLGDGIVEAVTGYTLADQHSAAAVWKV